MNTKIMKQRNYKKLKKEFNRRIKRKIKNDKEVFIKNRFLIDFIRNTAIIFMILYILYYIFNNGKSNILHYIFNNGKSNNITGTFVAILIATFAAIISYLYTRYCLSFKFFINQTRNNIKGSSGEKNVMLSLKRNLKNTGSVIIPDYIVKNNGSLRQFDFLVINNKGIFIIEVKSWSGSYHIAQDGRVFIYTKDGLKETDRKSPIDQNQMHKEFFERFIFASPLNADIKEKILGAIMTPIIFVNGGSCDNTYYGIFNSVEHFVNWMKLLPQVFTDDEVYKISSFLIKN